LGSEWRPFDVVIIDDSDADARHAVGHHAMLKRLASVRVVLLHYARGEVRAKTLNATLTFALAHKLRLHLPWLKEQRGKTRQCSRYNRAAVIYCPQVPLMLALLDRADEIRVCCRGDLPLLRRRSNGGGLPLSGSWPAASVLTPPHGCAGFAT
jgi:hypothetical protein